MKTKQTLTTPKQYGILVPSTHEEYWEMLECLPPASHRRDRFAVGEPYAYRWQFGGEFPDDQKDAIVYHCYFAVDGDDTDEEKGRFVSGYFTIRDYLAVTHTQLQHAALPHTDYLIFSGLHAALMRIPQGFGDGYSKLQDWFGETITKGRECVGMRRMWDHAQELGIPYHEELAGPGGASFELFCFPDVTPGQAAAAKANIRMKYDVVRMRVFHFEKMHDVQAMVNQIFADEMAVK